MDPEPRFEPAASLSPAHSRSQSRTTRAVSGGCADRIAGLLRSAHPLRVGSALRQAGEILTCVAPPERAAVLDRAIHLALTGDEGSSAVAGAARSGISPGGRRA
ncbi:MAG: hypothetical protein ABW000_12860 [Actinoplanes sp.]